jgi:hypothetical protein
VAGDAGNQITVWSIVSLLAGTVISAIVSYVLQRNSFSEARRQRAQERLESRKELGLNLFHKMIRIASTLEHLKRHLDEAFARAKANKLDGANWQIVRPLANVTDRVKFAPDELTLLMLMDITLFNDIAPFDDIHNNLLDVFELYRTKREAFTNTLPAMMNGNVGTTELSPSEMMMAAPRMSELDMLIDAITQRTQQDSKEAWELLTRLKNSLNGEFDLQLALNRK